MRQRRRDVARRWHEHDDHPDRSFDWWDIAHVNRTKGMAWDMGIHRTVKKGEVVRFKCDLATMLVLLVEDPYIDIAVHRSRVEVLILFIEQWHTKYRFACEHIIVSGGLIHPWTSNLRHLE